MDSLDYFSGVALASLLSLLAARSYRRWSKRDEAFLATAARTTGVVHGYKVSKETFEAMTEEYSVVVHYQVNGIAYQTNGSYERTKRFPIGSTLEVAYDPNVPSEARVIVNAEEENRVLSWIFPLFLFWVAVMLLAGATRVIRDLFA